MSQPILIKVYANATPVSDRLERNLREAAERAMPAENLTIEREDALLRLAFEGVWFPEEEIVGIIERALASGGSGKLDALDLESWTLRRYVFAAGKTEFKTAPLNDVLAYSGH